MDDERLRAVTIGELVPLAGPIVLAEYDPAWPALFRREQDRIGAALAERALRIEHPRLARQRISAGTDAHASASWP